MYIVKHITTEHSNGIDVISVAYVGRGKVYLFLDEDHEPVESYFARHGFKTKEEAERMAKRIRLLDRMDNEWSHTTFTYESIVEEI